MRKLFLVACLSGLSVLSYAQCVVNSIANTTDPGTVRWAINQLNIGNCGGSVTVQAAFVGTVNLTNTLNISASNKSIDLTGLTLTSTSNIDQLININASSVTLNNVTINRANRNGIRIESGANNVIQNSKVYEVGQTQDTVGMWTGIKVYAFQNRNPGDDISYAGIRVESNASAFTIRNNTVSGNNGHGILVVNNTNTSTKLITGNTVGATLDKSEPYGNFGEGIRLLGSRNIQVRNNYITANGNFSAWSGFTQAQTMTQQSAGLQTSYHLGNGVEIDGGGTNVVQGNIIGTNGTATSNFSTTGARFGNHKHGIYVKGGSTNNQIGGTALGEGNIVGGNGYAFENVHTNDSPNPSAGQYLYGVGHGIQIDGASTNLVYGNYVGWYAGNCIENRQDAMSILGYGSATEGNKIGGALIGIPGQSNIFTGGKFGVFVQGSSVNNNDIIGNFIGSDVSGTAICSPEEGGVFIQAGAKNNEISQNTISNVAADAIVISGNTTTGNDIQNNIMECNTGGISLQNSGNTNYAANTVSINVPTSTVNRLEGITNKTTDRVDVYIADDCNPVSLCQNSGATKAVNSTGAVQGLKWIATANVTTDTKFNPANPALWSLTLTQAMKDAGLTLQNAVVTSTENIGNTSQFNICSYLVNCDPPASATIVANPTTAGFCPGGTVTLTANAIAGHQYTWYRNNVKVGGGSGSTNNTFIASQAGNYTVKIANIIDTNNCAITSSARTVTAYTNPTAPEITGNDVVCTATTVNYSVPNTFASYTWSITPNTSPVLTFTGQGTNQIAVNYGTATGTRTIQLNVTNANGCTSTTPATKSITIRPTPTVGSASVSDTQICADGTLTMTGNTVNAWESGVWSGHSNIVQPTGSTNATADLPAGSYTIRYTVSNGGTCVSATKDFPVKVDGVPTPSAAKADRDICSPSVSLSGNTVVLPNTARWISDRPAVTFNDNTSPTATASGLPVGVTRFIWEVSNGVCAKSTDTVFVTRVADLTVADAGADQTICEGSPLTLTGSTPQAGETVLWENLDNEGTLSSTNTASTDVTGLMVTANYRYTVSNGVCSNSSDEVKVTVQQPATATFTDPLNYLKQTETAGASITANLPINYTGSFTKVRGIGNIIGPEIINGGEKSTSVNNLLANGDSILVRWTLTDDLNVCPTTSDSALVIRAEVGSVTFTLDSICETNSYGVLNGSRALESYESGQWIAAESDDFDDDVPADPTRIVPNFSAGPGTYKYVYQITNNNTGESEKGTKTIVVSGVSSPAVILSPDAVICDGNYPLEAQAVAAGNVAKWSPLSAATSTLTSTSALNPTIQDIPESNRVSYIWSVKNGVCPINRDTVFVTRTKKLTSANPTVSSEDSLCEGMIANVTGSLPDTTITPKERGVWSVVQGSGLIDRPNYFRTSISDLGVGENIIKYKIGNGVCTSDSATVTIVIDEKPDSAEIVVSNDLVICDDEYRLEAVDPDAGNGLWTTSNTAVGILAPDSSSTLVTNLPEGEEVTFTWTVSSDLNKCTNPPATVKISRSLDLTQADAGANQLVCNGEQVKLTGTPKKPSETSEWSLVPANSSVSFSSATNSDSTRVIGLTVGLHKFYYTIRNGVCNDAIDSVTVDIKPLPTGLDITAASDTLVCFTGGSTGDFFATGTNAANFIWTLPSGASEQSASANKDQITVEFSEGTASQKIYVSAVSEFNCASAGKDSLLVKRLVIPAPDINTGNKSCSGVENKIFINGSDSTLIYTWSNSENIPMNVMNDTIRLLTPDNDYTVSVTATRTDLSCDGFASEPVEVFDIIETSVITGLVSDSIINQDGKCEVKDERFPSTTTLTVNVLPSSLTLADLTFEWQRIINGIDTTEFPANTTNMLNIDYSLLTPGEYRYRVIVGNKNCADNELEAVDDIELFASVPVDYNLSDNTVSCVEEEVIFGVRNNGDHDDNVKYTWYHNNHSIKTDLDFFDNPFLNRRDSSLLILQIDTIPLVNDTVFDSSFDYKNHTTYYEIVGGEMAYDNYKIIGKKGEKIVVKAQPEYCIVYDKDDKTKGEYLLTDTVMTSDYVLDRPGADAAAIDLNSLNGITVNEAIIDINGYVIEYDELIIDKVEDRFALYDVTNKGGVEPDPLTRNWYVVDENGDYSQSDITSNKDVLAYPNPINRPELITYRLIRGNGVCKDSNDVNVKINYLPWPPNAFSPNGDGYYDKFEITNVDKYEGTTVTIFNRWGTEIVKIDDYHLEENWWDGTKGGDALPTGGYFYLIDFNNGTDPITGAISLIK